MKAGALEVDAREAERLVMAGHANEALALADATLAHEHQDLGVEVLAPCSSARADTPWRSWGRSRALAPPSTEAFVWPASATRPSRCRCRCKASFVSSSTTRPS